MNTIKFILLIFIINCAAFTPKPPQFKFNSYRERDLQVSKSFIPGAGNGVFARIDIPANEILGVYTGKFITEKEHVKLGEKNEWHYVMGLEDCAAKYTNGYTLIDGRNSSPMAMINYAPKEFQNVRFNKLCKPPFVQIVSTRQIKAGEELYVDYGTDYIYDFMEYPEVKKYFEKKRKR